jgi:alpha-glucosidase
LAVAQTDVQYSAAGIPLQTQWMDIDYMYERWIQTLDPDRFAQQKVKYVVDLLHSRQQEFIVMVR